MIRVALHLENEAKNRNADDEVDIFGRSAFNRYYYATFWIIRDTLGTIEPTWAEPAHSSVPDLLKSAVLKKIRNQLKKGLLPPRETEQLRNLATVSATNLANLMTKAYFLRIQADYKPENKLTKTKGILYLSNTKSSEAASWPSVANMNSSNLLNVAKQLGLV